MHSVCTTHQVSVLCFLLYVNTTKLLWNCISWLACVMGCTYHGLYACWIASWIYVSWVVRIMDYMYHELHISWIVCIIVSCIVYIKDYTYYIVCNYVSCVVCIIDCIMDPMYHGFYVSWILCIMDCMYYRLYVSSPAATMLFQLNIHCDILSSSMYSVSHYFVPCICCHIWSILIRIVKPSSSPSFILKTWLSFTLNYGQTVARG